MATNASREGLWGRARLYWKNYYQQWLNKRLPSTRSIQFDYTNLFVFFTRQGLHFLLLSALLWIGATNYQNNLAYALCFLLLAITLIVVHVTFFNISGLKIQFVEAAPVFAGEVAQCQFLLSSHKDRSQITLRWNDQLITVVNVRAHQPVPCSVALQTSVRGILQPGRLLVLSEFPLGFVKCWAWPDLAVEIVVYPQPIEASYSSLTASVSEDNSEGVVVAGGDDYYALKSYALGDPLSRIAWKSYAAGKGLFVREYVDYRGFDCWLDYDGFFDADAELRLSKLCYCAIELTQQGCIFGLRLPNITIEPDVGAAHLDKVLDALARCSI